MYRHRITQQVRYGHFREYLELCHRINDLARERGWPVSTFWAPVVGVSNELVIETDYEDLSEFERAGTAFMADADAMALLRQGIDHVVEESVHDELLQVAPQLA